MSGVVKPREIINYFQSTQTFDIFGFCATTMDSFQDVWDEFEEFLKSDQGIPIISIVAVFLILFFFSDAPYFLVDSVTKLLFYAVLVRIWSAFMPSDSELLQGDWAYPLFILISIGAVSIGIMIEETVFHFSGPILPAQFLALSILISGMYLKLRDDRGIFEIILWESKHERYIVLIPSCVVMILPIIIRSQRLFELNFLISRTVTAFLYLSLVGIAAGAAGYLYLESEN